MLYDSNRVDVTYLVTYLNCTPICEWFVVWCGFKNGFQIDMFLKGIGPCAQKSMTILGSIVGIIEGTYLSIKWAPKYSH